MIIIDVRTPAEFNEHHVEGAINIPLNETFVSACTYSTTTPLTVYCRSGARALQAKQLLNDAGFTQVTLRNGTGAL